MKQHSFARRLSSLRTPWLQACLLSTLLPAIVCGQPAVAPVIVTGQPLPDTNAPNVDKIVEFQATNGVLRANDRGEVFFVADVNDVSGQGAWRFSDGQFRNLVPTSGLESTAGLIEVHDDDVQVLTRGTAAGVVLDEVLGNQPFNVWRWNPERGIAPLRLPTGPNQHQTAIATEVNGSGSALVIGRISEADENHGSFEIVDQGVWLDRANGTQTRIITDGALIPGSQSTYENTDAFSLTSNEHLLFRNGPLNRDSLWRVKVGENPERLLGHGDSLTIHDDRVFVDQVGFGAMNEVQDVVGSALIGTNRNEHALWRASADGAISTIAVTGDSAPGLTRRQFGNFLSGDINAKGDVIFSALLISTNTSDVTRSIWRLEDGEPEVVVSASDVLPGLADDDVIQRIGDGRLNELGQIAFEVAYQSGLDEPLKSGIWASQPDGTLVPVAIPPQTYVSADGESFDFINFDGEWDFNNQGSLFIEATTTLGTQGIFRFDVDASLVPEPEVSSALLVFILMAAARRRRSA